MEWLGVIRIHRLELERRGGIGRPQEKGQVLLKLLAPVEERRTPVGRSDVVVSNYGVLEGACRIQDIEIPRSPSRLCWYRVIRHGISAIRENARWQDPVRAGARRVLPHHSNGGRPLRQTRYSQIRETLRAAQEEGGRTLILRVQRGPRGPRRTYRAVLRLEPIGLRVIPEHERMLGDGIFKTAGTGGQRIIARLACTGSDAFQKIAGHAARRRVPGDARAVRGSLVVHGEPCRRWGRIEVGWAPPVLVGL